MQPTHDVGGVGTSIHTNHPESSVRGTYLLSSLGYLFVYLFISVRSYKCLFHTLGYTSALSYLLLLFFC